MSYDLILILLQVIQYYIIKYYNKQLCKILSLSGNIYILKVNTQNQPCCIQKVFCLLFSIFQYLNFFFVVKQSYKAYIIVSYYKKILIYILLDIKTLIIIFESIINISVFPSIICFILLIRN